MTYFLTSVKLGVDVDNSPFVKGWPVNSFQKSKTKLMVTYKQLGEKIKRLREGRGWPQELLAEKLNLPRPAISQIESGQRKVGSLELKRITKLFNVSFDELFDEEYNKISKGISQKKKCVALKFNQASKAKLKQVLLYILEKCGAKPNVGETVLYKLLYFCDFNFYELYEKPLTGLTYKRIKFGPSPCGFEGIVKEMIKKGQLKKITADYYGKPQKKYIPLIEADLEKVKIGVNGKEVIDNVINSRLSDMNASAIADYSHQDIPCETTPEDEIIDYELVFYRKPAYSVRNYPED